MSDTEKSPTELWLEEFSSQNTRRSYAIDFATFLKWAGKTDTELVEEWRSADDKRQWVK